MIVATFICNLNIVKTRFIWYNFLLIFFLLCMVFLLFMETL
uniref:Uncharacterized protein n=1 Tax=Bostrychia tenella TaxID=324755 RepID=A0A1Z1M5M6_9FLOR|nr:hypothetical protein [Bostrychia tenella]ARW61329.1 hypothetical protein [Bostrychia tenella]